MKKISTNELEKMLKSENELVKLSENYQDASFKDYYKALLKKYGMSHYYVSSNINYSERHQRRMVNGASPITFDFVISAGLIIGATLDEINKMLRLARLPTLYPQFERDRFIIFCISKRMNYQETNNFLEEYGIAKLPA